MSFFAASTSIIESDKIGNGTKIWHFSHVMKNSEVGENCVLGKFVTIEEDAIVKNNVKIQNCVSVSGGVTLEDNVFVGPLVSFTNDLYPRAKSNFSTEDKIKTLVKKGASIGAGSTIICGIIIGSYALIGAGSAVTKSVPDYGIVYGNPARLKGWICECGYKLNEFLVCGKCGKKYVMVKKNEIEQI